MSYRIKSVFRSLQGEGFWAGSPAVFIRFTGCNLWSGHDQDRTAAAQRSEVKCPLFCDTDFVGGLRQSAEQVVSRVKELLQPNDRIVLTGGEPMLQLDVELASALRHLASVAIETNGTVPLNGPVDWITVSPKVSIERMALRSGDELKVIWPSYRPDDYEGIARGFKHLFVQPEAAPDGFIYDEVTRNAAHYCLDHPSWRLSLQLHQIVGLP